MEDFTITSPTTIYFGQTALAKALTQLKQTDVQKVMLVYGQHSAKASGNLATVLAALADANITVVENGGHDHASWTAVQAGIQQAQETAVEAVIGLGGSTCMDMAKAIAFGVKHDHLWTYLRGEKSPEGLTTLPILEIPSYPSGGSEADATAEVYDTERDEHGTLVGVYATYAVLDPRLSLSLSRGQTLRGAMVTFIQQSLNYLGDGSPIANGFSKTILTALQTSMATLNTDLHDLDARATVMWAATLTTQPIMRAGVDNGWFGFYRDVDYLQRWLNLSYMDATVLLFPHWLQRIAVTNPTTVAKLLGNIILKTNTTDEQSIAAGLAALLAWFKSYDLATQITTPVTAAQWHRLDDLLAELPADERPALRTMYDQCVTTVDPV